LLRKGRKEHSVESGSTLRSGSPVDVLVVGLGNPGAEFEHTRHNVGADTVMLLAARCGERFRTVRGANARAAELRIEGHKVVAAFPLTYMNDSGRAVGALVRRYGIEDLENLVVVHDELDLPVGRVKVKLGGGTAGHNGLKSIHAHLHDTAYARVRIGIGKPPGRRAGADHVLRRPGSKERDLLEVAVEEAADAVEAIVTGGVADAMNRFNTDSDA
jgi:peptidyl-tRNA hydrolase, PTH1 family